MFSYPQLEPLKEKRTAKEPKWRQCSQDIRKASGWSLSAQPWTTLKGIQLRGVKRLPRVLDLIDTAWMPRTGCAALTAEQVLELRKGFWVDYSQNHDRQPWGGVRCLTTSTSLYSFERDREVLGIEHIFQMGWAPSEIPSEMTDSELKDLAGEAQALPCLCCAIYALILAADLPSFWSRAVAP